MKHTAEILPINSETSYFGPATLIGAEQEDGTAEICWQKNGLNNSAIARIAIPRNSPLQIGDEVLLSAQTLDNVYITGLFSKPLQSTRIETHGVYAKLVKNKENDAEESLQVYTSNNELLFSYDPKTNNTRVNICKGNLELGTENGDIHLNAANAIHLNSQALEMDTEKFKLHASSANMLFGRLESTANTLIENAKNVYRNVKQLTQLRSGRMRTLVDESYHFKANKAMLKTEEDYKIKAEKIHLG